ncbi:phosphoribosyl-AMP cyclohydrolase [Nitratireductor basaltis]|uniref:Phosphoribosyl-AMP cyclohydrolase n=1 Tax=Nitratireductor basaltis TaxID=472175 RepID=A0A084UBB4_9HYPH|nr:phosphoribosyl-AMP cyclohydrolase [Nitratireductor basaltis]KFB10250.1 Phosphoribosyl-AMP cyclohydrolase [Nitratireductor basaltis]
MNAMSFTPPPADKKRLEQGAEFTPRFDEKGLVTTVVTESETGRLLMVAHMNAEALALTLQTGIAHYWSRSRKSLWKKGETSGNMQRVHAIETDCDQDVLHLKVHVEGDGVSCHTGAHSCFYRQVELVDGQPRLVAHEHLSQK